MSSQDVAVSEAWTSDSKPQDIEPSVISSENHTLKAFSLIESEKGYWILPRSGMTSKRSTESRGVESWIASLQESRANHTPSPEKKVVQKMIETYGLICGGSRAKWNPESSWWKTSQVSLVDLEPTDFVSSETSNGWVMSWSNELYLPEQSEHHTAEIESSLLEFELPTVVTSGTIMKKRYSQGGRPLTYVLTKELSLPTPTASDASQGTVMGENDKFYRLDSGAWRKVNQNGIDGSAGLARVMILSQASTASEESPSPKSSSEDPIYLNPSFGEAMMGFPIAWTALRESETLSFLMSHFKSQQKSRGSQDDA